MNFDPAFTALITAILGTIVAIISLVFSSRNQEELARVQSRLNIREKVNEETRLLLRKKLSEFYDPILVMLEVNGDIYSRLGPGSPIRQEIEIPQNEISEMWTQLLYDVIIPNNEDISRIIKTKLHLLSPSDNIDPYIKFVTHAHAYKAFKNNPMSVYQYFQFPKGLEKQVEYQRQMLYDQLIDINSILDE